VVRISGSARSRFCGVGSSLMHRSRQSRRTAGTERRSLGTAIKEVSGGRCGRVSGRHALHGDIECGEGRYGDIKVVTELDVVVRDLKN
jgi:hypothetical protein